MLIVTGRVSMALQADRIIGTWEMQRTENPSDWRIGEQIGSGELVGRIGVFVGWRTNSNVLIDLNPRTSDDNVYLEGRMIGTDWRGTWEYFNLVGPVSSGRVELVKR